MKSEVVSLDLAVDCWLPEVLVQAFRASCGKPDSIGSDPCLPRGAREGDLTTFFLRSHEIHRTVLIYITSLHINLIIPGLYVLVIGFYCLTTTLDLDISILPDESNLAMCCQTRSSCNKTPQ
jgi:hypothetical protein